jgi:outer membrane protein TolC
MGFMRIGLVVIVALGAVVPADAVQKKPSAKTPSKPAAGSPAKEAPARKAANVIESVSVQASGKFANVVIQSSEPLQAKDIAQPDGLGLSLYMSEPVLCRRAPIERVSGDLIEEIRYGYQGAKIPAGEPLPLDHITIRFKEPATYELSQRDWVLQVELRGKVVSVAAPPPDAESPAEGAGRVLPPARREGRLAVLPPNPGLEDVIRVGLANHVPLRLAEEEYRLSRIRHFEAARGLFPSATARWESSDGTLLKDVQDASDDIHFIRKEYGLQLGQPIFHSGGIYYGWRQAAMQKRAASQNVKKARADMVFDITRAYHNFLKSQKALAARRDLMERMDKVIELTRKKRQLELIDEVQALGAESQYSQAYYRLLSDEKDLEIARLRMEALLNLPEPMPSFLPEPAEDLDPRGLIELNVPVEVLVDAAFKNRPEMLSAGYGASAAAYAERVAKSEGRLHVDASGFVGRAGAAFTEAGEDPFTYKDSWNFGVQASLFFLGNSVKGTRTKDSSAPDYGETTATETTAKTASVGFLDGIKQRGDRRQARINRERAYHEREQTRRNIEVEVREAYYGIQKAKIQIKGAQQELKYRQKELGISRQKERMNLVEPIQSLQAEASYGDAVNGWEEAVSFYKVSLASLEKAVGAPLDSIAELK